ncbi:MAG TPA: flagellar M-ring protein FliF C-terminal domain-containing protein [Candidatus Acidoferrales bacterium]|nr:flagellar M-ring protein FliF C-terminal domain-containing protein [Candidatus Acidoferrales bacterium]
MKALVDHWAPRLAKHRVLLMSLAAAALVATAIGLFLGRDMSVALFAEPLDPDQVTEVVTQLAVWNVPFVAGSDNVRVDSRRRNDLLLRLSLAGIPHAHLTTSNEELAGAGPLTPQSVLDEQQLEGLAGDLALGLRGVTGVADARVIIAPAKPALFADDASHDASASVRLSLEPGATLTPDQADGIRAFVAAGVPGLDAKRVALLDDRGVPLDEPQSHPADEAQTLQTSLQSALDTAFGPGATIVRVRTVYDPLAHEIHEIKRTPLDGATIGTTTLSERYTNDHKAYQKTQSTQDRGSDLQDEQTDIPAGRLTRLSVAIMVDQARGLDLAKLRDLATATLGLIPADGDELSVEEVPFVRPAIARPSRLVAALGLLATVLPTLVVVVGVLIAARWSAKPFVQLVTTMQQRHALQRTSAAVAGFAPAQVRGALSGEPPHTAAAIISALPTATATAVLEMYPPEERAAIVRRMQRATAPIVPDYQTLIRRA